VLDKLGPPKSAYCRHSGDRDPKADRWADVRPPIREALFRTPDGMGCRQVAMALRAEQGLAISGKTVLKLMREEGPSCRMRRKRYSSCRGEQGKVAENVLDRDLSADRPMEELATDVTELKVAGAKAHLSPAMDLCGNEMAAWSVSRSPNMAQTMEMLDGLGSRLRGPALLHSGQGWQCQQLSCQKRLEGLGLTQGMPRKATCLGNACMEGLFGHLEDEPYRDRGFDSLGSLKGQLDGPIGYWNARRHQAQLKEMTPVQYRGHPKRAA